MIILQGTLYTVTMFFVGYPHSVPRCATICGSSLLPWPPTPLTMALLYSNIYWELRLMMTTLFTLGTWPVPLILRWNCCTSSVKQYIQGVQTDCCWLSDYFPIFLTHMCPRPLLYHPLFAHSAMWYGMRVAVLISVRKFSGKDMVSCATSL